jgi:hypothetical protein
MEKPPERYSEEKASEEAERIRVEVADGRAGNYAEAEKIIEAEDKAVEEKQKSEILEREKKDQVRIQEVRDQLIKNSAEAEPKIENIHTEEFFKIGARLVNTLDSTNVVDKNSLNTITSGILQLREISREKIKAEDFEKILNTISKGINEITNIRGQMFDRQDLEIVLESIRYFRDFGDAAKTIDSQVSNIKGIEKTQISKTLHDIYDIAYKKSYGFSSLADAMAGYLE